VRGVGLVDAPRSRSHRRSLDELHRQGWGAALLDGNDLGAGAAWWFGPHRHRLFRGLVGGVGGARPASALASYQHPVAAHRSLGLAFEEGGAMAHAARAVLAASARWSGAGWNTTGSPADRGYPTGDLGDAFAAVADMVRSGEGLHLVAIDHEGYDTHRHQGDGSAGALAVRLDELARGLASFWSDLGPGADAVSVAVVTEFGRTVHENHRGGTNHGRGAVAIVLDAAVRPGLHGVSGDRNLARGSLPVTTSVHRVLADVLERRGWSDFERMFGDDDDLIPGVGLFSSS